MANQTITTAVNYDDAAIAGLLNGETITNNGGSLTINSDVRWNQQAAVMGNIFCNSALGGSVLIDGTTVWELTFTASTGNVPTQGALGTNGVTGGTSGATGELLRVWQTGSLTPITTGGGAMPATGWIKLRSKAGTFQAGEIVTLPGGATITIADAGKRSWLHIVGGETLSITAARVSGTCSMTGDWYELGTTNGTDDQTFQFPVADYCPAIQIETAVGSGVYEWWLHAPTGVRWGTATQYVATDVRGKYFGIDPTTGVITIARRATNACGFKPVSGLNVRVPNLILSNSNSTNWALNTWNTASATTRYRAITGTNNPDVTIDKICSNWDWVRSGFNNFSITNSALMPRLDITQGTGTTTVDNIGFGCTPVIFASNYAFVLGSMLGACIVSNIRATCVAANNTSDITIAFANLRACTLTNIQAEIFGTTTSVDRGAAVNAISIVRAATDYISNVKIIGGQFAFQSNMTPTTISNIVYADKLNGTTNALFPINIFSIALASNVTIEGPFSWFGNISNVQPYSNFAQVTSKSANVLIRNFGTSAAPIDCGNNTAYFSNFASVENCTVRQCYVQNTRLNVFYNSNMDETLLIENVGADYSDTNTLQSINTVVRGAKLLNATGTATAANGCHFFDVFTSATAGRIIFAGNAPSSETGTKFTASFGPNSGYSGAGSLIMVNVGDTAEWIYDYFVLGHTGLANATPTFTGASAANFTIEFQYDTGSGFNGTWLAATGANLSGVGAINPATGIKLKVRATVNTASTNNALSYLRFDTVTTSTAQDTLYPLPFDATGSVTNLITGSRVQIYNQTTATEVANQSVAGTSYSLSYYNGTGISAGDTVRIRVAKLGYLPQTLLAIATSTGFSATANQQVDSIYVSNGIDGSTVTEFTADYPNIQMDIADPDGVTTVQRIYAWLRYNETTSNGISQWFNAVTPTDAVNYLIDTFILNLQLDNRNSTPVQIINGRLYRSDNATIIAPLSNSIQMDPFRVYLTDGISTTQTAYNNLADTFMRRSTANVEASTFGDPVSLRSMYGMVSQGTHNTYVNDKTNKLVVTKSNDTTILGTRSIQQSPNAQPITGLDSD